MPSMRPIALAMAVALISATSVMAAEVPKSLLDPYLKVQVSLAGDSTTGVAEAAKAIETAATPLGADASPIAASAKKLNAAKTIADARGAFGELSTAIIDYAAKTKSDLPPNFHIAHCPMADKSWLQTEKDIKNPYYGSAMLTCGSFKK